MAFQKITLSINPKTYQTFQKLAKIKGISISGWVTAKMNKEIEKTKILEDQIIDRKILAQIYKDCMQLIVQLTHKDMDVQTAKDIATNVYGEDVAGNIIETLETFPDK